MKETKSAEEILQKHWPHEETGSYHERDIINAMEEYKNQFKGQINWEELRDRFFKDLTKEDSIDGTMFRIDKDPGDVFEWFKNQLEDRQDWLKGYEKGYSKCVEDQKLLESVKNDMADRQAGIEQVLTYMKGQLAESKHGVATATAVNGMFDKLFYQMMAKRDEKHLEFIEQLLNSNNPDIDLKKD